MYQRNGKYVIALLAMFLLVGCNAATPVDPSPMPVSAENPTPPAKASPTSEPLPKEVSPTKEAPSAEEAPSDSSSTEPVPPLATWKRTYGGNQNETIQDLVVTQDGGYLILGSSNIEFDGERAADIYLARVDTEGSILWEETYSTDGFLHPVLLQAQDEGGFYISGVQASADTDGMDIFALHLDSDRKELSWETFGGPLDQFGAAWPMEDGGYILGGTVVDPDDFVTDPGAAGYGGHEGRSNIYFARVDAKGNELWSHSYGDELNVMSTAAALGPDGGFLILGTIMYYPESGDDILLLRIDADGEIVWSRTWEEGSTNAFDMLASSDGNYLISAAIDRTDDPADPKADFLFIKVDADGNEIWRSTFGDPEMTDYGQVVAEASDGAFVAAGESVVDLYTGNADIAVVKIDEEGQLLWQEVIDHNAHTMFAKLLQHPDGGFVIAGSAARNYQFDIVLIKTDANGRLAE